MTVWREVGEGVFVRRYEFYDQNIGVVAGDDGLLVVDTRTSHRQGEEIRSDLRALSPLPVRRVVNTHFHSDHCFGNRVFRPAEIWGHVRCATRLAETGEQQRAKLIELLPDLADDWRAIEIDPPDRTFEDEVTIDAGGRAVTLRYLGRGHSDNDIVVLVPAAGVVFAGDLLENGAPPFFGDGYPLDWPATVERLAAIVPAGATVVPGHGDPGAAEFVADQLAALRAIEALARSVHAGERDLEGAIVAAPFGPRASREPLERGLAQLRGELG